MLAYNVHFKISLNQLSLSHESNKKSYKERNETKKWTWWWWWWWWWWTAVNKTWWQW